MPWRTSSRCSSNQTIDALSKCSGLLGRGSHRSSGWGRVSPRPPRTPVSAEVPLRCIPMTTIQGPLGISEPGPGWLTSGNGGDALEVVMPWKWKPLFRSGPREERRPGQRWSMGRGSTPSIPSPVRIPAGLDRSVRGSRRSAVTPAASVGLGLAPAHRNGTRARLRRALGYEEHVREARRPAWFVPPPPAIPDPGNASCARPAGGGQRPGRWAMGLFRGSVHHRTVAPGG